MAMTIDALLLTLNKAKKELSGDAEVVLTMNPAGTSQGHIDRIHATNNADGKPVLAFYSLIARKYKPKT